jgi:hypothetical protein
MGGRGLASRLPEFGIRAGGKIILPGQGWQLACTSEFGERNRGEIATFQKQMSGGQARDCTARKAARRHLLHDAGEYGTHAPHVEAIVVDWFGEKLVDVDSGAHNPCLRIDWLGRRSEAGEYHEDP